MTARPSWGGARAAALLTVVALLAACGSPPPSTTPGRTATTTANANATAVASAVPASGSPPGPTPVAVALAVVADVREPRDGLTGAATATAIGDGSMLIPCGVERISLAGAALAVPAAACVPADELTARVHGHAGVLALLPYGLVSARVKVLRIDGADLLGPPSVRAQPYALVAMASDWPAAWGTPDPGNVRTVDSTGDTCPDRGPAKAAIVDGKGWDWVIGGGTAGYTGFYVDHRYSPVGGNGYPVPYVKPSGNAGAVRALVADADVTANDFECPMLAGFVYHGSGTVFNIDPKVAPLMARLGVDVVTLGSNHITDAGASGVRQTLSLLDANGIAHSGAGLDLVGALAPAVVDVRGLKFAFVGWDDIAGSGVAAPGHPGVAPLTAATVKQSLALARQQADVVFAMPQWGWPEYHADFTKQQLQQRAEFFADGADHVLGSGTHWAAAVSITLGADGNDHFVISSHGNFLFGQNWSRQTMEGVVVELTFVGKRLVQARLHPYVVYNQAQPNLIDPTTDGTYVLNQVWSVSQLP